MWAAPVGGEAGRGTHAAVGWQERALRCSEKDRVELCSVTAQVCAAAAPSHCSLSPPTHACAKRRRGETRWGGASGGIDSCIYSYGVAIFSPALSGATGDTLSRRAPPPPPSPPSSASHALQLRACGAVVAMGEGVISRRQRTEALLGQGLGGGQLDVPRQPNRLQRADHQPAEVQLPPLQPVSRRVLERVVVVVPACGASREEVCGSAAMDSPREAYAACAEYLPKDIRSSRTLSRPLLLP